MKERIEHINVALGHSFMLDMSTSAPSKKRFMEQSTVMATIKIHDAAAASPSSLKDGTFAQSRQTDRVYKPKREADEKEQE